MNFLAHFFLSSESPSLMVGNFLGDFVKGKEYQQFPEPVAKGILLHRAIDSYTDIHPDFLESKHRLVPQYGHFAGIVVDIFYDHLLAVHWEKYAKQSLKDFSAYVYQNLQEHQALFPAKAASVFPYMVNHNWLLGYAQLEGIQRALEGMAQRSRFASGMEHATENLKQSYTSFNREFHSFFPQIIRHVSLFLSEHS